MKKNIIAIAAVAALAIFGATTASAQSGLGNLLKTVTENSTVKNLIETATGISLNTSIVGNWDFKGSAVALSGENITANLAASAASTTLAAQIDPYLEKVGIKPGDFQMRFASDSTFAFIYGGKEYAGTYSISGSDINLVFGKTAKLPKLNGVASVSNSDLKILFKADTLLKVIKKITATVGANNATISTINSVIKNYSGMKLGFDMGKIQ